MARLTVKIAFCIIVLTLSHLPRAISQQPISDAVKELQSHNIGLSTSSLLGFLQAGLGKTPDLSNLPDSPRQKTQLVLYAIEELGKRREKAASELLLQLAMGQFTEGINSIVTYDVAKLTDTDREISRAALSRVIQYNCINALGLIGEKKVLPVVDQQFEEEKVPRLRINYALTLASLEDSKGITYLLDMVRSEDRFEAAQAAQALYFITSHNFKISDETPIKLRHKVADSYQEWWKLNQASLKLNGEEIIKRRLNPPEFKPTAGSLRSLREVLYAASFIIDPKNEYKSFEAREWLKAEGDTILPQLKDIALNDEENLRIRAEAIKRYAQLKGKKARRVLKRLRKDRNPDISRLANNLLQGM